MTDKEIAIKRISDAGNAFEFIRSLKEIGSSLAALENLGEEKSVVVRYCKLADGRKTVGVFSLLNDESDSRQDFTYDIDPCKPCGNWTETAQAIDRMRDKVCVYYGFDRDRIEPIQIADVTNPLKYCLFDCIGVRYCVTEGAIFIVKQEQE